jgi:hypothetical protein
MQWVNAYNSAKTIEKQFPQYFTKEEKIAFCKSLTLIVSYYLREIFEKSAFSQEEIFDIAWHHKGEITLRELIQFLYPNSQKAQELEKKFPLDNYLDHWNKNTVEQMLEITIT